MLVLNVLIFKCGNMKKICLGVFCLTMVLLLASCQKKHMATSMKGLADKNLETTEIRCADSLIKKDYSIRVSITAEFPKNSKDALSASVQEWISEQLGSTYQGSFAKGKSMLKYYVDKQMKVLDAWENGMPGEITYDVRIRKIYETDLLVTYQYEMEGYFGGAHGARAVQGVTFRKVDGRRMDWSIFLPDKSWEVRKLITQTIQKDYFEIEDDKEFHDALLIGEYEDILPRPQTCPVYVKDGLSIIYQQYEVAPYAAGMPSCILPYETVKPLLSVTGQLLLPEAQLASR